MAGRRNTGEIAREGLFQMTFGHELINANVAFLRLFGYKSVAEFNSLNIRIIVKSSDVNFIKTRLSDNEVITNHRVLLQDSSKRTFWGSLSCLRHRNGQSYYGSVLEASEVVDSEIENRALRNELHKLTRELDRFVYSASHDIRAPISTILGLVNLIKLEKEDKERLQLVNMIGASVHKLDGFVQQLTHFARNFHQEIDIRPVNLEEVVTNLSDDLRKAHPNFSDVKIARDIQLTPFQTDPTRLATILHHVIRNGLDFFDPAKPNKTISIQAQLVRGRLVAEIFDNGIGIPDDRVGSVFNMFYKGTARSRGSGMGLYLVREMVTRLNGTVNLYSKLGVGTLVRIEIPDGSTLRGTLAKPK